MYVCIYIYVYIIYPVCDPVTALQVGRLRIRFPMVSLEFFIYIILLAALWPSNKNEYQEYFLECKGGRCIGLTLLPPSCADCLEIWEP